MAVLLLLLLLFQVVVDSVFCHIFVFIRCGCVPLSPGGWIGDWMGCFIGLTSQYI